MRTVLICVLLGAGCGGGSGLSASSKADLAGQPGADDLATHQPSDMAIAHFDLARASYDFAWPSTGDDMATQSVPPPAPDLAPACSVAPTCSPTRLPNGTFCCNGAGCINGDCQNTTGEPCSNITGPVCFNDGTGRSTNNGVCGLDGKCE